jgi:hypothetical protein
VTAPLLAAAWQIWLAGPLAMALQLLACLALAATVARRGGRSLPRWLAIGFSASVVPIAGLLAMAALAVVVRTSADARA